PATTGRQMRRGRRTTPARNHSPGLGNPVAARTQRLRTRPSTALGRGPIQAPSITENPAHLGYQTVQRHAPQYVRHPPPPANTNTTLVTRHIEVPAPLVTCVNTLTAAQCHDLPHRRWTDPRQG